MERTASIRATRGQPAKPVGFVAVPRAFFGVLFMAVVLCGILVWELLRAFWQTAVLGKSAADQTEGQL